MKTIVATICLCLCLMFMPTLASAATIDATSGGVEVIAPNQMIFHNLLVPSQSTYYFGVFQWSPSQNKWNLIDHGLEDPTFSSQEYYPLEQGRSWTYQRSDGGQLVLTVAGTQEICGQTCIRLNGSDGSYAVRTEETWYSEGVGIVKRVQTEAYGMGGMIFHSGVRCYDLASYTQP